MDDMLPEGRRKGAERETDEDFVIEHGQTFIGIGSEQGRVGV